MKRTIRQLTVDRQIIRSLLQVGSYLLPEDSLREQVEISGIPEVRLAEFNDSMRVLESQRLIISGDVMTGTGWKITAEGRVWASENRISIT